MLFGLTNIPAVFQSLVNNVLCDILVTGYISVYIDDILIFSETREEHAQHICLVLQRLLEWAFNQTRVPSTNSTRHLYFLGFGV